MDDLEEKKEVKDVEIDAIALHTRLSEKHIFALKQRFLREPNKKMEKTAFRNALCDIANIIYSDEEFQELFLKLDFQRTRTNVSWEGFLIYLLVGFRNEDLDKYSRTLYPPIKDAPKEFKSQHKLSICGITFVAELTQDRIVNYMLGNYITCSKDGRINYWSIDMEKKRTEISKSQNLRLQSWITCVVALPDVEAFCTCSTERDLRFYDTAAKKFELRIVVKSFRYLINAMYYTFYTDPDKTSKLLIGDAGGRVHLITIVSLNRGPFKNKLQNVEMTITHDQFCNGAVPLMSIREIPTLHTDWVVQVAYYETIHCTVSVSRCSKQSMLIYNMKGKESCYSFKVKKGFSCFSIAQTMHMVATGGPDCLVRIWNPFVTVRATTVFRGHHSEIVSVVLQDDYKILISFDEDECIKVWDVLEQVCLQTYLNLPASLNKSKMCTFYNPSTRQLIIASDIIVTLQIYPLLDGEYTDGISHTKEVSVILYNKLFQVIITCGYDSFIIVWNPFTGRRKEFIRDAHTTSMHAEKHPVEITAAAFDPSEQFLITGASDGTLKVWNFNIGSCCRNLAIGKGVQICAIIWIKYRILVMGENRGITEFADDEDVGSSSFKCWTSRHLEDILCAIAHVPQILVTASYGGEIVFWRLETGQAYSMFNVINPSERIQSHYIKRVSKKQPKTSGSMRPTSSSARKTYAHINPLLTNMAALKRFTKDTNPLHKSAPGRISINALAFLTTRTMSPKIGTVLAALDNGMIQIWSHHPTGGFITEYKATHSPTDYVVSMCTDEKNQYLFTGHMAGYIKTWHLINFGIPEEDHVHINMPKIRLKFPFLLIDTLLGRAKRAHKSQKPLLVNSFKAHFKAVTGLLYIDMNEMVVSCSSDGSARLWTLGGRYMGTLGTFKPWTTIYPGVPADEEEREFPIPADIQRTGSFTTLKVLTAGKDEMYLNKRQKRGKQATTQKVDPKKLFGPDFEMKDILGKHFKLPVRHRKHYHFQFDLENAKKIPVFINIELPELTEIQRPPTPELIKQIRKQQAAINRK